MRFEIEFFRWTAPGKSEVVIRRSGQFSGIADVKTYGLTNPDEADGFRILRAGEVRGEVLINQEPRNA